MPSFNAGSLFNMDALQEQDDGHDQKAQSTTKHNATSNTFDVTGSFFGGSATALASPSMFGTPTPSPATAPRPTTSSLSLTTTPPKPSLQQQYPLKTFQRPSPPPKSLIPSTKGSPSMTTPKGKLVVPMKQKATMASSDIPSFPKGTSSPVRPSSSSPSSVSKLSTSQQQDTTGPPETAEQQEPEPEHQMSSRKEDDNRASRDDTPLPDTPGPNQSEKEEEALKASSTDLSQQFVDEFNVNDDDDGQNGDEGWDEDDVEVDESEEFDDGPTEERNAEETPQNQATQSEASETVTTSDRSGASDVNNSVHDGVDTDNSSELHQSSDGMNNPIEGNPTVQLPVSNPETLNSLKEETVPNGSIPPAPAAPLSLQGGVLYRSASNDSGQHEKDNVSSLSEKEKEKMQKHFSDQLQRLEQNHQSEQALLQKEFERAMADITQQLQQRDSYIQKQETERRREEEEQQKQIAKLQSELKKAKEFLLDKEREDRRLQEAHLQQLRDMEKQMNRKEDTSHGLEQQMHELQKSLEESKSELKISQDEYATLKERAKSVAAELKERRAECRTLASEIELLQEKNDQLQDRITQLEAHGMDLNQSSKETMDELESLRAKLKDMENIVSEANSSIEEERKKGDEALSAYKKKAQQSLALANSRAAAAVQAKEEAELEARAARTTADSAMQRALAAEAEGKRATAEASSYVKEMEIEVAKYTEVKASFEAATNDLEILRAESLKFQDTAEQLKCELTSVLGRLEAEQATVQSLKQSLTGAQERSTELYNELERLRKEGKRNQDEIRRLSEAKKDDIVVESKPALPARNAEAEATISMLKQELEDANQAIKDLKETLKTTMEERDTVSPSKSRQPHSMSMSGDSNGGMPLFYAMEKQAELTQARDEIARLASLLGDAESTKQEALENMEEMKLLMEDAQSRLKRQEQLQTNPDKERVNLEYLKNIMLSYLNAKTAAEKKTLLPVLGTVLCLTPEEQRKAMDALDKGGAASVVDSVATTVLNLKWS